MPCTCHCRRNPARQLDVNINIYMTTCINKQINTMNNDKYIQFYIIYSKAMNVFRLQKVQKVLGSRPQMFQVHFASFHHHAWKWTPLHGGNKLEQVGTDLHVCFSAKSEVRQNDQSCATFPGLSSYTAPSM